MDINNWVDVPGYDHIYQILIVKNKLRYINKEGNIVNLLGSIRSSGHFVYSLRKDNKFITVHFHQLVMVLKAGKCPPGMEVCHNDGNPENNHPDNLRYDTRSANALDMYRHGFRSTFQINHPLYWLGKRGSQHTRSKRISQYTILGEYISVHESSYLAQDKLGICQGNIIQCCKGKRKTAGGFIWKYS